MKSKIDVEFVGNHLNINLIEVLLNSLPEEELQSLAESLSLQESIMKACVEVLLHDVTREHGFWGGDWTKYRQEILDNLDQIGGQVLRVHENERRHAEETGRKYRNWAFHLFHAWPDPDTSARPRGPEFVVGEMPKRLTYDEAFQQYVKSKEKTQEALNEKP